MTRPIEEIEVNHDDEEVADPRLARSTARAFTAALCALLISTLIVSRTAEGLTPDTAVAGTVFESGTISLTDDDGGHTLFDLADMAPGRPTLRCIEVVYEGTILPVDISLISDSDGDLSPFLEMQIEEGVGGGFESCDGFEPTSVRFVGTLAELTDKGAIELGVLLNVGESRSYRFRFDLADREEALGRSATADFVWEVIPQ